MSIVENLQKILTSRYGKDVRQAIHDAIEDCYADGKAGATDLIARQDIATETTNRTSADTVLDGKIGVLDGKISTLQTDVTSLSSTLSDAEDRGFYSKNLLKPTLGTSKVNDVTCTNNGDGTYTLNGTASADASFHLNGTWYSGTKYGANTYKIVGCQGDGSAYRLTARVYLNGTQQRATNDMGSGATIVMNSGEDMLLTITVMNGKTVSNVVVKPMLVDNAKFPNITYADYTPYTHSTHELSVAHDDSVNRGFYSPNLVRHKTYTHSSGIVATLNSDGSITVSGTNSNSSIAYIYLNNGYPISAKKGDVLTFSGMVTTNETNVLYPYDNENNIGYNFDLRTSGSYKTFTVTKDTTNINIYTRVPVGGTINMTYKPQLEYGVKATDFVPYVPSNSDIYDDVHDFYATTVSITSTIFPCNIEIDKQGRMVWFRFNSGSTQLSLSQHTWTSIGYTLPSDMRPLHDYQITLMNYNGVHLGGIWFKASGDVQIWGQAFTNQYINISGCFPINPSV